MKFFYFLKYYMKNVYGGIDSIQDELIKYCFIQPEPMPEFRVVIFR